MKKKVLIGIGIFFGIIVIGILGLIIGFNVYYSNRWFNGTLINGIDVSKMTLEESEIKIKNDSSNYSLEILARDGGRLEIDEDDIDYDFQVGSGFQEVFRSQHEGSPILSKENNYSVEYDVSYDESKLKKIVESSELIKGSKHYQIRKPKSATVKFSKENEQYECVPEDNGNTLKKDEFLKLVDTTLMKATENLDISQDNSKFAVYEKPEITSENPDLQTMLSAYNQAALRYIVWDLGNGVKEKVTPSIIMKWIKYQDGAVSFKNKKVESWVEKFCLKYKTVGIDRTIKSHTGKNIVIKGGDYGWQIDYEKTLKQMKKALNKKISEKAIRTYNDNPNEENRKKLTINKKISYLNTAFQRDMDQLDVDWDTENYTEVCLDEQMIYVIRKGKVAFSCRCISGLPVEGRKTTTGAFYVKEHRPEYTMKGADYTTHVKNWVRITWSGTGFHPATWQPWSRWTKDLYKSRGSHGCLNLSPEDAVKIYELVPYREAVFMHY